MEKIQYANTDLKKADIILILQKNLQQKIIAKEEHFRMRKTFNFLGRNHIISDFHWCLYTTSIFTRISKNNIKFSL